MTVEIRELIIKVEVTEPASSAPSLPFARHREWDDERWVERIKQEILEQLLERGRQ
ncbi:hypothetical protein I9G02_004505 [Salmonella enterica]|nr:hypothetical protein [Salmonella enterica subsp. salamae]EGS6537732.1 hypothetical protein [Salmonella enterica]EKE2606139.1 hypothetical protein [Salmonella enterica]HCB4364234.1 hypothetical protein [Salmonella enterica]